MPQFLKNSVISLLDGGIEAYYLALHGMSAPLFRASRKNEAKYAPVIGLYGAAAELIVKACLVQAKGIVAMYKEGNLESGTYRFGSDVIEDFRRCLRDEEPCISYIWEDSEDHTAQKEQLLHCLEKFKLLQSLRANGLHAGLGCSRDVVITVATDLHNFVQLLSRSKKLRPYLKNIPAPEVTVRDREAIIEDLTRRLRFAKTNVAKADCLRNMYLVLPYIPEIKPDWIDVFDRIAIAPPSESDLSYLAKTLSDAHSIYLLKNRGGKEGIPVKIEPQNPHALPIAIQNIKRTLNSTPDKFLNDVLTANTRLEEKRLDLPLDEFLVDLYALGLVDAHVLDSTEHKLTAQQTWPFVAAAYSTNGCPRPCWHIVRSCNEIGQLISYIRRAGQFGNGYLKRRLPELLSALEAIKNDSEMIINSPKDKIFKEIVLYRQQASSLSSEQKEPFTPAFLKKYPIDERMSSIVQGYITGNVPAGDTLAAVLESSVLTDNDRKIAHALLPLCFGGSNKNGIISVLHTDHLKGYISYARKIMFFTDFIEDGPCIGIV